MRQREILNAAKEQAGMTQKEFAKYFGIPLRTVEGWFTEKREIPDYLLRLMLYRLEIEHKVSNLMQYIPFPEDVYTDQIEHTARRYSAWLPPIQCTLSGHQCMMLIQV